MDIPRSPSGVTGDSPLASLTCECKRERCLTCLLCGRCGCEHDGVPIAEKLKRRRGRPKQKNSQSSKTAQNEAIPVQNGGIVDRSDVSTRLDGRPRRTAALGATYEEEEEPEEEKLPSYQDILRYFGEEENSITNISKKMISRSVREDLNTWKPTEDHSSTKSVVFSIYEKILEKVAESVCGADAADASVAAFLRKMTPKDKIPPSMSDTAAVFRPLATAMAASKRGSIERRTERALMCGLFKQSEMHRMEDQVPGSHLGKNAYSQGRADFQTLMAEGVLPIESHARGRFDPSLVNTAIKSILSCDNVTYRVGDTKGIVLDGKYHDVPAMMQRRLISVMYDDYVEGNSNDSSRVSKTAFYRLCRVLTHGETDTQRTTESGLLVDDSFSILTRIMLDFLPDDSAELLQSLGVFRRWLEYGQIACVAGLETDSSLAACPRHDTAFGLASCAASDSREVCCGVCLGMDTFLNHIEEMVKRKGADANTMSVVHDCFKKIELYMGHRLRSENQQQALAKIVDMRAMQGDCLDEAVVTIAFKVNAEPVFFDAQLAGQHGEHGARWHGATIQFWAADPEAVDPAEKFLEQKLYYNYVSSADNGHMKETVAALVEAVLIDIKRDLPQIKRIVVHSDNTSSYQNVSMAVLLPILGFANGLEVTRFILTEVEGGKSLLEAQFARAARKVKAWVREDHDCTTPPQLVAALISDGGLPDTTAEIIEYDRGSLRLLSDQIVRVEKAFAALVDRVNDISYEYDRSTANPGGEEESTFVYELTRCPSVWARTFRYSGVGLGKLVEIDTMAGVCSLQASDEDDADVAESIQPVEEEVDDIAKRMNWEQATGEGIESEDDAELDLTSEIVLPRCAVGLVTGIRVITEAQIRRRTQKLPCTTDTVAELPASREPKHKSGKDMVTHAKHYLLGLKNAKLQDVVNVSKLSQEMTTLKYRFSSDQARPRPRVQQGWAQKPPKEIMYGARYAPRFLKDMKALLERGGRDRHDTMGPTRIVEVLRSWNTKRYDVPGENEVRAAISQVRADKRKRGAPAINKASEPRKKRRMEQKYDDFFKELVTANRQGDRKEIVALFRKKFPEATELFSDARLKNKVSILRRMVSKTSTNQALE